MDYNSHHSLHYDTHIPIHHCTNHTAVINHSLTLIVSPHLHLIHTHTYKQHTSLHSPRSLVLPRLTFWAVPLYSGSPVFWFPCILVPLYSGSPVFWFPCILVPLYSGSSVFWFPWTAYTLTVCCLPFWPCLPFTILSVCRLPRPLHCPCCWFCLAYVTPVIASALTLACLTLPCCSLKLRLDLNATLTLPCTWEKTDFTI